ncbi:MAG TPA: hypothetical protein VKX33_10430 [Cyclobacteriaceae bacterium]|nr:hypothetical protein [Cyclobacteriaceae bacterium]
MSRAVFKESQKFNHPLLWIAIGIAWLLVNIPAIQDLLNEYSMGNNLWNSGRGSAALVGIVVTNLVVILFLLMKLETRIDASGIQFRYPPMVNSWRKIPINDIHSIRVIRYFPWAYGGWGIRLSWHGWAYNVKGNKGIMFKRKSGKQLLIGTQSSQQVQQAVNNLMGLKREREYGE